MKYLDPNNVYNMDVTAGLPKLRPASVNCCVTSPPYFNLRDYKVAPTAWPAISYSILGMQIDIPEMEVCLGLEAEPKAFIGHLVHIFRLLWPALTDDGTLWINMGDSYNGYAGNVKRGGKLSGKNQQARYFKEKGYGLTDKSIKNKDLMGIPWMLALALRDDGWYLRQDIIWNKKTCMPESVTDRCTKSHEYIFLLSKSAKYYFNADAIKTLTKDTTIARSQRGVSENHKNINGTPSQTPHTLNKPRKNIKAYIHRGEGDRRISGHSGNFDQQGNLIGDGMANKRSVWTIAPTPFSDAHFAVFPEELPETCIKAGCPPGGIVLDLFMGSGTTAVTAKKLDRPFIGFEVGGKNCEIIERRLENTFGFLN